MSDTLQNIVYSLLNHIKLLQSQGSNEYVWVIPANATSLLVTRVTNELEKEGLRVCRTTNNTLTVSWCNT